MINELFMSLKQNKYYLLSSREKKIMNTENLLQDNINSDHR